MANGQSFRQMEVPLIQLYGVNIARDLYGNSASILPPKEGLYFYNEDLQSIRYDVSRAKASLLGVTLRPVRSVAELKIGGKLLCLDVDFYGEWIAKHIVEIISGTTVEGVWYIFTERLWPEYVEISDGCFSADKAVDGPCDGRLYLHYDGPIPILNL